MAAAFPAALSWHEMTSRIRRRLARIRGAPAPPQAALDDLPEAVLDELSKHVRPGPGSSRRPPSPFHNGVAVGVILASVNNALTRIDPSLPRIRVTTDFADPDAQPVSAARPVGASLDSYPDAAAAIALVMEAAAARLAGDGKPGPSDDAAGRLVDYLVALDGGVPGLWCESAVLVTEQVFKGLGRLLSVELGG